jgi:hypothetical protein
MVGRNSSVGIAPRYGLDGGEGGDFPHPSRPALGPTYRPAQGVPGFFPWSKTPHLAPRLKKELSDSTPVWAFMACCRVNFTFYNWR